MLYTIAILGLLKRKTRGTYILPKITAAVATEKQIAATAAAATAAVEAAIEILHLHFLRKQSS